MHFFSIDSIHEWISLNMSSGVDELVSIGCPKWIVTNDGVNFRVSGARIRWLPSINIGITVRLSDRRSRRDAFLNDLSFPFLDLVPSGNRTNRLPF